MGPVGPMQRPSCRGLEPLVFEVALGNSLGLLLSFSLYLSVEYEAKALIFVAIGDRKPN